MQRRILIVPAIFVLASLGAIDYAELAERDFTFVLLLLLGLLLVGAPRCSCSAAPACTSCVRTGWPGARVAMWSSVIFGLVHLSTAIGAGGGAVFQAVAVSFAGYFFYLTRHVTGGLIAGAIVHGLFDFAIVSGELDDTHTREAHSQSSRPS